MTRRTESDWREGEERKVADSRDEVVVEHPDDPNRLGRHLVHTPLDRRAPLLLWTGEEPD